MTCICSFKACVVKMQAGHFQDNELKYLPSVENGETEMSPEESWEHKEEISEAEPAGGGSSGDGRPPEESTQEMMEEVSVRGAGLGWEAGLVPEGRGLHIGLCAPLLQKL